MNPQATFARIAVMTNSRPVPLRLFSEKGHGAVFLRQLRAAVVGDRALRRRRTSVNPYASFFFEPMKRRTQKKREHRIIHTIRVAAKRALGFHGWAMAEARGQRYSIILRRFVNTPYVATARF
jgi:hypothetical protein